MPSDSANRDDAPLVALRVEDRGDAGRIAWVTFDNPAKRNALGLAGKEQFIEVMTGLRHDARLRAVVISGAGDRSFVAGTDLGEMAGFDLAAAEASATYTVRRTRLSSRPHPMPPVAYSRARRLSTMRYGFYLPTRGHTATPEAIEALVRRGEALGFSSTMIADHVVFPVTITSRYPYTVSGAFPGGGDALEQLALMAFVAGKSTTLRLVTSVMILPHRNPVVTAKALATIDVLSGGRVTVGVGVGWLREEFQALGAPDFDRRGAVSDEYLRIFKTLWTESPASFSGQFYRFEAIRCLPVPVQKPHPPIWVGGHSKVALRRAARFGDGWHPVGANPAVPLRPAELRASLDELYRLTEAEGRDPKALTISYKAPVYDPTQSSLGGAERRPFTGSPEQTAEDIATFARLGVSELIFDFRSESLAESLERMERFGAVIRQTAAV